MSKSQKHPDDDSIDPTTAEVPKRYAARFTDLVRLTNAFCDAHLDTEYKTLCREMAVAVCQKDSPALKGKSEGWAAGIVYALGRVNFLDDPSQTPHMKSTQIAEGFGVSVGTMQSKAKVIREGLDLMAFDPDWTRQSKMDDNPLVWMLKVNGMFMDIRMAPREAQVVAYEKGLIPYIPADRTLGQSQETSDERLFELEVALLSGPITKAFVKKNPSVVRTIAICGSHTLEDLHKAIFQAFDRSDEHMYEFQVGGKRAMDPKARRYVLPMAMNDSVGDQQPAGDVSRTTIGALGLMVDEPLGYWFDFGDDWWHQVTVVAIHDEIPRGRYPKVTNSIGESPPQYVDEDQEDEDGTENDNE